MDHSLVGIIVLLAIGSIGTCIYYIYTLKALMDSQNASWERRLEGVETDQANRERQWEKRVEIALNRTQFPDLAMTQSASVGLEGPQEVTYVDEQREIDLESDRGERDASKEGTS